MTTTVPDDAGALLAEVRGERAVVDEAEVRTLRLVVGWAAMHSAGSITEPASAWFEQPVVLGGPGSPAVAEFCVPELAVALGVSHDAAAAHLGEAVELAHRLPATYRRVLAGGLRVWQARRIARTTMLLSAEAAAFVDRHVAPSAHRIGCAALDRLVEEALLRFDPDAAEERRLAAAERRRFDVDLQATGHDGVTRVEGVLDAADARDLEQAVRAGAADLAALGSTDPLDVRRSRAVGVLARRQLTLDLERPDAPTGRRRPARQVVIHVHVGDGAAGAVGWVEGGGCVGVEQVRGWCADSDTQVVVRPVVDLAATPTTDAWSVPDAMREQVVLRDPTCVFPRCGVSSRRCDLDHVEPWHDGGATTPHNLAPLCRRHHRLKTHGGWTYHRLPSGDYLWTTRLQQGVTAHADHRARRRP